MKKYIVQTRFTHGGRLASLGTFNARTELGAITQAAKLLATGGENAVELIATEQPA